MALTVEMTAEEIEYYRINSDKVRRHVTETFRVNKVELREDQARMVYQVKLDYVPLTVPAIRTKARRMLLEFLVNGAIHLRTDEMAMVFMLAEMMEPERKRRVPKWR